MIGRSLGVGANLIESLLKGGDGPRKKRLEVLAVTWTVRVCLIVNGQNVISSGSNSYSKHFRIWCLRVHVILYFPPWLYSQDSFKVRLISDRNFIIFLLTLSFGRKTWVSIIIFAELDRQSERNEPMLKLFWLSVKTAPFVSLPIPLYQILFQRLLLV